MNQIELDFTKFICSIWGTLLLYPGSKKNKIGNGSTFLSLTYSNIKVRNEMKKKRKRNTKIQMEK